MAVNVVSNQVLGLAFLVIATLAMLLMFRAWKYPYDKETHRSSAPRWMVHAHRILGWAFVLIYVLLMVQMIPRLWTYQVELPARTVAHLFLGLTIGGLLFTKIVIVRFFKHMEAKLVPFLGTALFLSTLIMIMLAVPLALREAFLEDSITSGSILEEDRLERLRIQLPSAGFEDAEEVERLITPESLVSGRKVLKEKCTQCHDLRTVLVKPRTPEDWARTVDRMVNRANVLQPISAQEQDEVTAYLIAISPTLQQSVMEQRDKMKDSSDMKKKMSAYKENDRSNTGDANFDLAESEQLFEKTCSQCHASELVSLRSPESDDEIDELLIRMQANGLDIDGPTREAITEYLRQTYVVDEDDEDGEEDSDDEAEESGEEAGEASGSSEGIDLANASGCMGCHNIEQNVIGPAWLKVASRYRDDPDAEQKLFDAIALGVSGNWVDETGGAVMPANSPRVADDDIRKLVQFILALPGDAQ